MVTTTTRVHRQAARLDLAELERKALTLYALLLMVVGGMASWMSLPANRFSLPGFLLFLSLLLEGIIIYHQRARNEAFASLFSVIGPMMSFAVALMVLDSPSVPFYAVPIVIMGGAVKPLLGLSAALCSSLLLLGLRGSQGLAEAAILLLWLTAAAQWLASRGLYTALDWAWSSQERANGLLAELRNRQEELNRTVAALTEATRRLQRTGYELAVARLRADEMRELKARFAANISHELRTPLNVILGFSEMMYLTPDVYGDMQWPSTLRRDVRQIYQNSKQLLALVNDVLDLSRIDSAEMPVHRELSDLRATIQEAIGTVSDLVRGRDLSLRADLPDAIPPLSIDRTRIRQVLINLLNNAVRFTERGSITVAVRVEEEQVVVSVADTGIGIPPEELGRIFDEFHQVDMSLRREREGAGLGLAISKRFVELHGGHMWVHSEMGVGSVFSFSLPLSSEARPVQLAQTRALEPRRAYEPSVVLLEPDVGTRELLSRYLKNYQVLQARDEQEAAALIAQWHPQALLVNQPPGEEWSEGTWERALRIAPAQMAVISCSIPSQRWLSGLVPVEGCLTKPFSRQELLDHVRDLQGIQDVLVVDDDRGFVQLVARYLESMNGAYRVRWAYEGQEALAQIRQEAPDLILLDLIMPVMDGLQFLEAMRSDPSLADIPVIIVTATDYAERIAERHPGLVAIGRRKAFRPMETIRTVAAVLGSIQVEAFDSTMPVPEAAASG